MSRYRSRPSRAPLTPPADLVGRLVRWSPRNAQGKRMAAQVATVTAHDPDARTLTVEQSKPVSPWSPEPTRTAVIPLSSGPFTIV